MTIPPNTPREAQTPAWDDLVLRLSALRLQRGAPSYGELARRVGAERARRGESHARPGRTTVYDLFRLGRRRLDVALLLDVVLVLGCDDREVAAWRHACRQVLTSGTRWAEAS